MFQQRGSNLFYSRLVFYAAEEVQPFSLPTYVEPILMLPQRVCGPVLALAQAARADVSRRKPMKGHQIG